MDQVKIKINNDLFERLIKSGVMKLSDVDVTQIEPIDYDYSKYEIWVKAKSESTRAFKKLKKIEYNIRHTITN